MASLKMTPAEAKAEGYGSPAEMTPPEYPYGTSLSLRDETAKAVFPKMPEVGTVLAITGSATVTGINVAKQQDGGDRLCIEIQVTDLDAGKPDDKEAPNYYGEKPKA